MAFYFSRNFNNYINMYHIPVEIDEYNGDGGCFIFSTKKHEFKEASERQFLFDEKLFYKYELDKVFGYKKLYKNHQDLINIHGCIGYIPVMCTGFEYSKSGKSKYAQLLSYGGVFKLLIQGAFKVDKQWINIDDKLEQNKSYILKAESNPFYPSELRLIDFRELGLI